MSEKRIKTCDRCGKNPINLEYTLAVTVREIVPDGGGWSTGSELCCGFDFCRDCKKEIIEAVMPILKKKP